MRASSVFLLFILFFAAFFYGIAKWDSIVDFWNGVPPGTTVREVNGIRYEFRPIDDSYQSINLNPYAEEK